MHRSRARARMRTAAGDCIDRDLASALRTSRKLTFKTPRLPDGYDSEFRRCKDGTQGAARCQCSKVGQRKGKHLNLHKIVRSFQYSSIINETHTHSAACRHPSGPPPCTVCGDSVADLTPAAATEMLSTIIRSTPRDTGLPFSRAPFYFLQIYIQGRWAARWNGRAGSPPTRLRTTGTGQSANAYLTASTVAATAPPPPAAASTMT